MESPVGQHSGARPGCMLSSVESAAQVSQEARSRQPHFPFQQCFYLISLFKKKKKKVLSSPGGSGVFLLCSWRGATVVPSSCVTWAKTLRGGRLRVWEHVSSSPALPPFLSFFGSLVRMVKLKNRTPLCCRWGALLAACQVSPERTHSRQHGCELCDGRLEAVQSGWCSSQRSTCLASAGPGSISRI